MSDLTESFVAQFGAMCEPYDEEKWLLLLGAYASGWQDGYKCGLEYERTNGEQQEPDVISALRQKFVGA